MVCTIYSILLYSCAIVCSSSNGVAVTLLYDEQIRPVRLQHPRVPLQLWRKLAQKLLRGYETAYMLQ